MPAWPTPRRRLRTRAGAARPRQARLAVCAALAALGVAAPPAAAERSAAELQAEIERQQALLRQLQEGDGLEDPRPPEVARLPLDARSAPPAPPLRELPVAIFDEAKVTIPAGHWGNERRLVLLRRVLDADGDGAPELVRFVDPESRLLVRQDEDRDYDGTMDAWSNFEWGELVRRIVDGNGDGDADGWARYDRGRMVSREVDRDYDGVRDAFYSYASGELVLEEHDANNDGEIDRTVRYRDRRRTSAEEDVDRDGRTDVWYRYEPRGDTEIVTRIERDEAGRGRPDVFETFEAGDGGAVLTRREEDVDGDGTIDIVSIYDAGKLVRRELAEPDLRPL